MTLQLLNKIKRKRRVIKLISNTATYRRCATYSNNVLSWTDGKPRFKWKVIMNLSW